jgi:hypothetical protein
MLLQLLELQLLHQSGDIARYLLVLLRFHRNRLCLQSPGGGLLRPLHLHVGLPVQEFKSSRVQVQLGRHTSVAIGW